MALVPATFAAALAASTIGTVLDLGPGKFGVGTISKKTGITIQGGPETIFDSLNVTGCTDVQLKGFTVDLPFVDGVTKSNSNVIRIYNSPGTRIERLSVSGPLALTGIQPTVTTLDASGNIIGLPTGTAIYAQDSDGVELVGNTITRTKRGIAVSNSKVRIAENDIHHIRTSPIAGYFGNDSVIEANHAWTSQPWSYGGSGDHGDFIHPWTIPTQVDHTRGLKILNNLYEADPARPIMGIYFDTNTNPMGFVSGEIGGNVFVSSNGQGMRLENVEQYSIHDNQLFASDPIPTDWKVHPRIGLIGRGAGNVIERNRAADVTWATAPIGWDVKAANQLGVTQAGESAAAVAAWLAKFRPQPVSMATSREPLAILTDMEALCAELRAAL